MNADVGVLKLKVGGLWVVGCGLLGDTHTPTTFKPKKIGGSLAVACDPHLVHPLHPVKEGKRPRANGKRQAGATQMRDAASLPNLSQLSACARHVAATGGNGSSSLSGLAKDVLGNEDLSRMIAGFVRTLSPEQAVEAVKAFQNSVPKKAFEDFKEQYQRTATFELRAYETVFHEVNQKTEQTFVVIVRFDAQGDQLRNSSFSSAVSARKIIDLMNAQFPILDKTDKDSDRIINKHISDRISSSANLSLWFGNTALARVALHETDAGEGDEDPLGYNLLHTFKQEISPSRRFMDEVTWNEVGEKQDALMYALRDMFVQELGCVVLPNSDTDKAQKWFRPEGPLRPEFVWKLPFKVVAWKDILKISPPAGVSTKFDAFVKAWRALYLKTEKPQ